MELTIKKVSQNCERWFYKLLMKNTVLFCCVVTIVSAVGLFFACGHMRILSTIYAVGAILAASVALIQWASDRCVKRAELVNRLIEKITAIDPNSLAADFREADSEHAALQEKELTDKLSFLSYIAYLEATGILSDDEFNALRLDLVRILENRNVLALIDNVCSGNKDPKYVPYSYLVQYGAKNCEPTSAVAYDKILLERGNVRAHEGHGAAAGSEHQQQSLKPVEKGDEHKEKKDVNEKVSSLQSGEIVDTVSSGKTYDTHLDVLNGIFKLGYRAHMRGGATLPDGRVVWFPKYYDSASRKQEEAHPTKWVNILDAKEGVLSEYWPSGEDLAGERGEGRDKEVRYVFGMDMKRTPLTYRFLGVYEYKEQEKDHFVYKRRDVVLHRDEVEHSLNPDNY